MTSLKIRLSNNTTEYGYPTYRPNEYIEGNLLFAPDSEVNAKSVTIWLEWHTEGKGSRHTQKVDEYLVHEGPIQAGWEQSWPFSFQLPEEPWSYEGHYINIVWELRAKVDIAWAKDPNATVKFRLEPDRRF